LGVAQLRGDCQVAVVIFEALLARGVRRVVRTLAVAIALALVATLPSAAAAKRKVGDGTGGVELRQLGEFESPVHIDNAPGSKRLLFVVEQGGTIRILRGNDTLGNPFVDIRDRVEARGEEGLLSVAFRRSTATIADPGRAGSTSRRSGAGSGS
jgi:hypothetical protein